MAIRAISIDSQPQTATLFATWAGLAVGDEGAPFQADGWALVGCVWTGTLGTLPNLQCQVAHDNPPTLFNVVQGLATNLLGLLAPAGEIFPLYARAWKPMVTAGVGTNVGCVMIFKRT